MHRGGDPEMCPTPQTSGGGFIFIFGWLRLWPGGVDLPPGWWGGGSSLIDKEISYLGASRKEQDSDRPTDT